MDNHQQQQQQQNAAALRSNSSSNSSINGNINNSNIQTNTIQINNNKNNSPMQTLSACFTQLRSTEFNEEQATCVQIFDKWLPDEQVEFVDTLLRRMCHYQHGHVASLLKPMLQRDFISSLPARGLLCIAESILSYLDARALCNAELVCREWLRVIADGMLWKKQIERQVRADHLWRGLAEMRGWSQYLFKNNVHFNQTTSTQEQHRFYKELYDRVLRDIRQLDDNWSHGNCLTRKIQCRSENSKGVYCLQYDYDKIVCGLRDNTIKVWSKRRASECLSTLSGHTGSVLCLQYDADIIVSGSSDTTVRVWSIATGHNVQTLRNHKEAVLHLRFMDGLMVTCSKDRQIIVWDMHSPTDIQIKRTLSGHRAAVNVVDFDQRFIVSASGDRTIKVWLTSTCEFVRTLIGHKRGIACLQYRGNLVVSGSSDFTIRIWDIDSGECLRILEGHEELVRCIRFDGKRIVSGAYDGKIKIWDLRLALDHRVPLSALCIQTLTEHTGRVFRLQFDEFQIVSSSHDDTIIIWDFLNAGQPIRSSELADQSVENVAASISNSGVSATGAIGSVNQPMPLQHEPISLDMRSNQSQPPRWQHNPVSASISTVNNNNSSTDNINGNSDVVIELFGKD